jgi:hypothetical protein
MAACWAFEQAFFGVAFEQKSGDRNFSATLCYVASLKQTHTTTTTGMKTNTTTSTTATITVVCLCLLTLVGANYDSKRPEHEQAWVHVCKNHCHLDGGADLHTALKTSCGAFRFVMPRPRVHTRCRDGFVDGMELACHNYCSGKGHTGSAAQQQAAQFCKKYKQELPKPGAHEACRKGHAAGAVAAHQFAMKKHAEYNSLKAAVMDATEAQIENVMEKEAQVEEAVVQNTEAGHEVTNAEKKAIEKQTEELLEKEAAAAKYTPAHKLELAREAARSAFETLEEDEEEYETDGNATEIDL